MTCCSSEERLKEVLNLGCIEGDECFLSFRYWSLEIGMMKTHNLPTAWFCINNLPHPCWVRSGFQNLVSNYAWLESIDQQTFLLERRDFARIYLLAEDLTSIPTKIQTVYSDQLYEVSLEMEVHKSVSFCNIPVIWDRKDDKAGERHRGEREGGGKKREEEDAPQPSDAASSPNMERPFDGTSRIRHVAEGSGTNRSTIGPHEDCGKPKTTNTKAITQLQHKTMVAVKSNIATEVTAGVRGVQAMDKGKTVSLDPSPRSIERRGPIVGPANEGLFGLHGHEFNRKIQMAIWALIKAQTH